MMDSDRAHDGKGNVNVHGGESMIWALGCGAMMD
jgi:hypothetical protein